MYPAHNARWRWHVKAALASTIARAHDFGFAAALARGRKRPLVLGYHRVVDDFAVGRAHRDAEHAHEHAHVRAPSRLHRQALPVREPRRSRRARPERRTVRSAGGRHHLRRRVSRQLRARVSGAEAQGHPGGGVRRDRPGRPPVLAGARQALSPGRESLRHVGRPAPRAVGPDARAWPADGADHARGHPHAAADCVGPAAGPADRVGAPPDERARSDRRQRVLRHSPHAGLARPPRHAPRRDHDRLAYEEPCVAAG